MEILWVFVLFISHYLISPPSKNTYSRMRSLRMRIAWILPARRRTARDSCWISSVSGTLTPSIHWLTVAQSRWTRSRARSRSNVLHSEDVCKSAIWLAIRCITWHKSNNNREAMRINVTSSRMTYNNVTWPWELLVWFVRCTPPTLFMLPPNGQWCQLS